MQVSVEVTSGLERKLTVELSGESVAAEIQKRMRDLSKNVKMNGFRNGKVPMSVVKKRFGGQVRSEILDEMARASIGEALQKEDLKLASMPVVEDITGTEPEAMFVIAKFEVYPEFSIEPLDDLTYTRKVATVESADVDRMIETLRDQQSNFDEVERAAADNDQVKCSYEGFVDGELFEGGKDDDASITIGEGRFIPGFEEQLIGASSGDKVDVTVVFPEDYHQEALAGKEANFKVVIISVLGKKLPEVDEAFAKNFGVDDGNIETMRTEISANLEKELKTKVEQDLKAQVTEGLLSKHEIDVPTAMVESEVDMMLNRLKQQFGIPEEQEFNIPRDGFMDEARKRVALGLVFAKLVEENTFEVSDDKVQEALVEMVSMYEETDAVIKWYNEDPERLAPIQSKVMEDQVVEWVLGQGTVAEQASDFESIVKGDQKETEDSETE